jgi:TP901 family phage tail tape measure protein
MAAGSIVVSLLMNTGSFETDTKRAEKRSREMAREIDKAFKMVSIAVAAAGAAFVAMTKSVINSADQVAKASRSIGIATESLSALQFAAELSGVSSDELSQALLRLNKSAADGNKAFEAMGIQVRDAQGNLKATDALLKEVSDKFASYADGAEKSALAQELFGRGGARMISFLNSGSQGLDEMRQEAERLGVVIDSDLAKNAEIFNDNLTKMKLALNGMVTTVANSVLPVLVELTNRINDSSNGMGALQVASKGVKVAFEAIVILGANVAFVFQGIGREIGGTLAQINRLMALDFTGFAFIAEQVREDSRQARAELDAFERRVLGLAGPVTMPSGAATGMPSAPPAPTVGGQQAFEAAKKEREAYDDFMRLMQEGENRYRLDMIDKRIAAEKQAELEYQAFMDEMREGELQQYLKMQDLKDERIREANDKLKAYADQLGMAFGNAFENAIMTGQKLSDTLKQLAQDIARLVLRQTVTGPIAEAISGSIGTFMGARANGGPVTGGGTYMVGERGPELFVPNTSGMIVPHEALQGGGGGVTVQQTINVTTGVQQTVRAEILSLMPQISNAAKAAVADAKLRGGSYSAALR